MIPDRFVALGEHLADALRPPSLCAVCHGWGDLRVCAACLGRFAGPVARCRRCAIRVPDGVQVCGGCLVDPPPFDHACAAVEYAYPWDGLVSGFKFRGALDLAGVFGRLLATAAAGHATPGAARPDLILPVPLSRERLRERGYNQAWELARRVGRHARIEADPSLLLRLRDTPHQLALLPSERSGNVRDAFAVEPRKAGQLQGAKIVLVDDVMTTGATAGELAGVLKRAGAATVGVWVLARTPHPTAA